MEKTNRLITPGGKPVSLANPSSSEAGSTDSGESHLLHLINPFAKAHKVPRSPPSVPRVTGRKSPPVVPKGTKSDSPKTNSFEQDNCELQKKLNEMIRLYEELKKEVESLREENKMLKTSENMKVNTLSPQHRDRHEYETDEDELARETEKSRPCKKRKAEHSPKSQNQLKPNKITRKDQFSANKKLPPPINIVGQADYNKILPILKETAQKNFKATSTHNNTWKINVNDSDSYRKLSKKLSDEKIEWYSYSIKEERPLRVVARGLHPSCSKEDILSDLKTKGFKILDATNLLKREKGIETAYIKRALPLFILSFDKNENVDNVYNIKTIMNIVVKIEPLRKNKRLIPQCKRCQGFNHTKAYCQKDPVCVKCAGKHMTDVCRLKKETPATCANCKGNHPANYRGCEVAKEMLKRREEFSKKTKKNTSKQNKELKLKTKTNTQASSKTDGKNNENVLPSENIKTKKTNTYAQVTAPEKPKTIKPDSVQNVFSLILERLEEQGRINTIILEKLDKFESAALKTPNLP